MTDIKIEKAEVLSLVPGDILLVHVGMDVTKDSTDALASIGEQLTGMVPDSVRVLVVCGDIEFKVARPEELGLGEK